MNTNKRNTVCSICSRLFYPIFVVFFGMLALRSFGSEPVTIGSLGNEWELGELLYEDNFDDPDMWKIQIEASSSTLVPEVKFENGMMDMYMPSRGATAWLKEKFEGPVLVIYDVLVPEDTLSGDNVRLGDVNTFLHASDPVVEDNLFNDALYTGSFGSYSKMNGYYASTGGGRNTTTRMRRYPRSDLDGNSITHLVMNEKDGQAEYLLTAGQTHSVQLAAADGHLQYVFDGKLVYEMKEGGLVSQEDPEKGVSSVIYDLNEYPQHTSGYFGFRTLRSHHQYSSLKVYRLKPAERTVVSVTSLTELRSAVMQSNQNIVMSPGSYDMSDMPVGSRVIACSGSGNTIDLTGVYVSVPVGVIRATYITMSGENNVWIGGEFENVYLSGPTDVTDYENYNKDRTNLAVGLNGGDRNVALNIWGANNEIRNVKFTLRGSFPYGYGSIYGIGADNVFGLDKRGGILITSPNVIIDGVEIQHRSFSHGIIMQEGADNTLVKNCLIEGVLRDSNELFLEGEGSLPYRSNYEGIEPDIMIPLSEDGIRSYPGSGSVTVENCTVKRMRGGIRLYLASSATVRNSTAIDCGNTNFNMPNNGTVVDSTGNFGYAPLSDFRLSRSGMNIEWTVIPSPHAVGPHNLADVLGNNHEIVFHQGPGEVGDELRPIVVSGNNSVIRNETVFPVILESSAGGNKVISVGPVTDNGTGNIIDSDDDGVSDGDDTDDDNDGYLDEDDLFPTNPNEWADVDSDSIGDNSDPDDDNDGVEDINDAFPLDALEWLDTDGDGTGNNVDTDDDGDGVADGDDLFPLDASDWADEDGDGVGDNAEMEGEFVNISTRAFVKDGNGILIGGIVIEGSDPMLTLIQGVGAELGESPFGLGNSLLDTHITLYEGNVEIASNDDWDSDKGEEISDAGDVTGSFVLEKGSHSSAILIELEAGTYTVLLNGKDGIAGVGLVEVYNVSSKLD